MTQQQLIELWEKVKTLSKYSPPADWEYRRWWGYQGYGKDGDDNFVADPDDGNIDDIHEHGRAVGRFDVIHELLETMGEHDDK